MTGSRWKTARLDDIASRPMAGAGEWKAVRHHLGIRAFGVSAYVASAAGDPLVPEHDELPDPGDQGQRHEELYFVSSGRATFSVAGEIVDAPAGTLLFAAPAVRRSAVAAESGTTVLAVGAEPGVAFEVSAWERRQLEG